MDTDLDNLGIVAVRTFVRYMALQQLTVDRAKFQQWSQTPGNSDITPLSLSSEVQVYRQIWKDQQSDLRVVRKVG